MILPSDILDIKYSSDNVECVFTHFYELSMSKNIFIKIYIVEESGPLVGGKIIFTCSLLLTQPPSLLLFYFFIENHTHIRNMVYNINTQ